MGHAMLAFMPSMGLPELLIVGLPLIVLLVALVVMPCCFIFSKAGYPGALGLLMIVPVANIVMLFFLAFSNWPLQQKLEDAQAPTGPPPLA